MSITDLIPFRRNRNRSGEVQTRGREDNLFEQLHDEMNRLFEEFLPNRAGWNTPTRLFGQDGWDFTPTVDIKETPAEIHLTAELPGVDEKDLDVRLEGRLLTIRGEKREENTKEDGAWTHSECRYGSFVRTIPLDAKVDSEKIRATFRKGVLDLRLPKVKRSEPKAGRIEVKAG